jgi:ferredoxin-type protein NapG
MACVEVCPTGALIWEDPEKIVLGHAVIDQNRCLPWISSGCRRCVDVCQRLEKAILLDEQNRPYIDEFYCNGCGACVTICPQPAKEGGNKLSGKAVYLVSNEL